MLSEGRAEIQGFKKGVEGAIKDAKEIYQEISGIWGWIKSFFVKPVPKLAAKDENGAVLQAPKKTGKTSQVTYEEAQTQSVHQIFEQLKIYFEAQRQLEEHCRELEAQSSTTEKIADNAIDLIEIRWQMKVMSTQVREAMVYTPEDLGLQDLYSNFLKTYEAIIEEQEFARQVKHKREVDSKWRRELLRNHRIDRAIIVVTVLILVAWTWGFLLSLRWLVTTQDGSW